MPRVVLTALFLVLFLRFLFLCPSIRFSITFSLSSLFYFSFSFLSHSSFLFLSLFLFPILPSVLADFQVANPSGSAGSKGGAPPSPFRRLILPSFLSLPPFLFLSFFSFFSRLRFSALSRGPRTPAGLFVTPVFPGIPDLELIFVGRKLCRSHP